MIYEDYFKSVIGGNFKSPEYYNTYENKTYEPIQVNNGALENNMNMDEIIDLYPDIYKVVLPMVDKLLIGKNVSNLNDNILNAWTLEIYDSLEAEDNNIQPNNSNNQVYESETTSAKLTNKTGNIVDNRVTNLSQSKLTTNNPINSVNNYIKNDKNMNIVNNSNIETSAENLKENKTAEVVSMYQNRKNPILRDLIKIMILNRLFGNNYNRPPRPYPNFERENYNPMPYYRPVDANPYSKYVKNIPKTYFDTPYPEEG